MLTFNYMLTVWYLLSYQICVQCRENKPSNSIAKSLIKAAVMIQTFYLNFCSHMHAELETFVKFQRKHNKQK